MVLTEYTNWKESPASVSLSGYRVVPLSLPFLSADTRTVFFNEVFAETVLSRAKKLLYLSGLRL